MSQDQRNALKPGYQLDEYRIERVLGAGGFGITYLATDTALDRQVAIKEYLPAGIATRLADELSVKPLSSSEEEDFAWGMQRFRMEAETLVAFRHPNIVNVFRLFEANGTAYLVMAYEDGESLATILDRDGRLSEPEIYEFLFPLMAGLDLVHQAGFLHRDIKPANIYIRLDGSPVLLDFGSARLALGHKSHSLTSVVTAGYAPFEQYSTRGDQGPWTDIYAMGAVLYRAVTGEKPPTAPDRIRDDPMVPAAEAGSGAYSTELLAAIDSALAVDEENRPRSVADWRAMFPVATIAEDAETVGRHAGPDDEPTGPPTQRESPSGPPPGSSPVGGGGMRRVLPWIAGALAIVLVGAGGTYALLEVLPDDGGARHGEAERAADADTRTGGAGASDDAGRGETDRSSVQRKAGVGQGRAESGKGGAPARRAETERQAGAWRRHDATRFNPDWCSRPTVRIVSRSVAGLQSSLCMDRQLRASNIRYNDTTILWRMTTAKGAWLDCRCQRP